MNTTSISFEGGPFASKEITSGGDLFDLENGGNDWSGGSWNCIVEQIEDDFKRWDKAMGIFGEKVSTRDDE